MVDIVKEFTTPVGIPTAVAAAAPSPLRSSRALFWPELRKLPRPEYLVKGVLDAGSLAEIFGPTSCGKSFLGTDMGLHIAAGWDWNGHKVRRAGVLYVNAEGGAAIVNRLDAWQRHHNETLDDVAFAVVIEPTTLLDEAGVGQVIADAGAVPDLGVIFIDTAARVMPGGDEGAEAMSYFVAAIARIRAETGAGVVVIHHSGKDTSKGSRGSTVLPCAVDTQIEVSKNEATKIATVNLIKQRDGENGPLLSFALKVVELGTDADGDAVTSCVIEATEATATTSAQLTKNQQTMLTILQDAMPNGLTKDDWNDQARDADLGVRRRSDLLDLRSALKRKKLVHSYGDRWYVTTR